MMTRRSVPRSIAGSGDKGVLTCASYPTRAENWRNRAAGGVSSCGMISRGTVLVLLLAAGCATLGDRTRAPFTCPKHGGPPWIALESPHFSLVTDVEEAEARQVVK